MPFKNHGPGDCCCGGSVCELGEDIADAAPASVDITISGLGGDCNNLHVSAQSVTLSSSYNETGTHCIVNANGTANISAVAHSVTYNPLSVNLTLREVIATGYQEYLLVVQWTSTAPSPPNNCNVIWATNGFAYAEYTGEPSAFWSFVDNHVLDIAVECLCDPSSSTALIEVP
jgi:hypothetical protein